MRILFDIGHPAHVHFFKYIIWDLEKNGHDIKICVREREGIVKELLGTYGFEYEELEDNTPGLFNKMFTMFKNDRKLLEISKRFNPDVFVSVSSPYAAQVGWLIGKPSIAFTNTDTATLIFALTVPFTDSIITPEKFTRNLGKKQIRINGFKELAYLHPNRFNPDPTVLDSLGVSKDEKYVVLRFSSFDSSHDIGISGFTLDDKRELVKRLEPDARVFISSEVVLPADLEQYSLKLSPHKMLDVMYYASLLVGDSGTMTSEAAILGTPAIVFHPLASELNYLAELERDYQLMYIIPEPNNTIQKAIELIQTPDIKLEWQRRLGKFLDDKIDTTAFMVWFIENYPESKKIMINDPDYQEMFHEAI